MTLKNSKTENKALKLIYGAGKEGICQSEIRKRLDVSSREASRLAKKFETNGKIVREKVLINGRWTFNIVSIKKYVTIKSIEGNPCLICSEIDKCYRGGTKDATTCLDMTAWIDPRIETPRTSIILNQLEINNAQNLVNP